MQFIPAISLLVACLIVFIAILRKFNGEQLSNIFAGKNFLLLSSLLLFLILSVVHLFQNQAWTADVLKVIVGVFVGVSATFAAESGKSKQGVDMGSSNLGDNAKVAGRDINESIDKIVNDVKNMRGEISQVKDSIIKQYPTIQSSLTDLARDSRESRLSVQRRVMVKLDVTSPDFLQRIARLSRERPNLNRNDDAYIDAFVSNSEFAQKLRQKITEFERMGWRVVSVRLSDTDESKGYYFDFIISKFVLDKRVRQST